jgi:hypothetical protein
VSEQGGAPTGAEGAQAEAQGAEQHTSPIASRPTIRRRTRQRQVPSGPRREQRQPAPDPNEYLASHWLMEALKHKDADVTRGFQEHKQFREQWEPFSKIQGLGDMSPEDVGQLVEWSQAMNDPQAFQAWYEGVGQQLGLSPELDEDAWVRMGEEKGWFEGGGEGEGQQENGQGFDPNQLQSMLDSMLEQKLQPVQQWLGSQEQNQQAEQIKTQWEQQMSSLADQHGVKLDDARDDILHLMAGYLDDGVEDPVSKAFEHYLRISGKAQGDLIEDKLNQPGGALNGGTADTRPEQASWNASSPSSPPRPHKGHSGPIAAPQTVAQPERPRRGAGRT